MTRLIIWLVCGLMLMMNGTPANASSGGETVVILHGVALNRFFCVRLQRAFERSGYKVVNVSMPTRRVPIGELADEWLPHLLRAHGVEKAERVHFVTHSMGGLVLRGALRKDRPANLGRVVMIAPPNRGSELADRLGRSCFWRAMIGINLQRLGTDLNAFWHGLPASVDYPVGMIAGTRAIHPLGARYLAKPHDGAVSVVSTYLQGELDRIELPYSHTGLLFRAEAARQALAFLRSGRFDRGRKL